MTFRSGEEANTRGHVVEIPPVGFQPQLRLGRKEVGTVFDLLGVKENDLTYSLGWALVNAPSLMTQIMAACLGHEHRPPVTVYLQRPSAESGGFTDIEIQSDAAHVIMEAKRGWALPDLDQLKKYRKRLNGAVGDLIIVISEASPGYASTRIPADLTGAAVRYLPWEQIIRMAEKPGAAATHAERRLLRELARYLRGAVHMQDLSSNRTYCVSVAPTTPSGWPASFRDYVDQHRYFHPAHGKSGWPAEPPNYLAFRWDGAVRRIHHVEDYTIGLLWEHFPQIPDHGTDSVGEHMIYTLGPVIGPAEPLRNGAHYRSGRLWVALDLLLTSPTLKDALAADKARQARQAERYGGVSTSPIPSRT